VGSYPILASPGSLAAANYNFTVVGASVNVLPAVLTVAASNESAVYGSAIPALGYSISGFVNGDTGDSVVRGTPSIAANAPAQSGALSNSGSYTISASLGTLAASNYVFKFSSGRLSVLKAVVLVTPANVSVTYGTPLPALAASLSGFVNGDTQSTAVSGTPSLATSARSGSAAGSYPILAAAGTLASNNYSFSFAAATVTIGKAVLTVTPRPVTMIYGSALPALGCTYSGFANGDGVSSLHGAPQLSTVALSSSPVGQYSINVAPGTLSASNYNFQFTPGSITVAPAVLTVAANSLAVQAGSAMPPLTYSAKGLVNGDTLSSATAGVPSLSTNATMSQTGTYPIVAAKGTMAASNYQLAFANGTLTVTK
jgi:hypothetical protein